MIGYIVKKKLIFRLQHLHFLIRKRYSTKKKYKRRWNRTCRKKREISGTRKEHIFKQSIETQTSGGNRK